MDIDLKSYLMSNFPNPKYKNISLIYLYSFNNEYYKALAAKSKIAPEAVTFFTAKSKDVKQIRSNSEVLRNMGYESLIDKYLKEQETVQQRNFEKARKEWEERRRKEEKQRKAEEQRKIREQYLRKKEEKEQRQKEKARQKKWLQELHAKEEAERLERERRYREYLEQKANPTPQPVVDRYCLSDDTKMNVDSTVELRTKKKLPVYLCPKCRKRYMLTSREDFIRDDYTPCYVFGKDTPQHCYACKTKLIITDERIFGYWGRTGLEYCEKCRLFHVPFEMYRVSEQEWRPRNSDELKMFETKFGSMSKTIQTIPTPKHKTVQGTSGTIKRPEESPIAFKDFVIRRSVFKCKNAGHRLQNITGIVKIMNRKGEIEDAYVPAGYCPNCDRYFIMEITYQALKSKGVILCRVSDEKSYLNSSGDYYFDSSSMAQKSILKQCGYSVAENSYLTSDGRKKLLCMIIDNGILRSSEVISYLDWFIRTRDGQSTLRNAVEKWQSDLDFIREKYSGSWDQYRVSGIRR